MNTPVRFSSSVIAALLLLLATSTASAEEYLVDGTVDAVDAAPGDGNCMAANGRCTLRAALLESSQSPDFDLVSVPAGTYLLTLGGGLVLGEGDSLEGEGAASTIIDGANGGGVLGLGRHSAVSNVTMARGVGIGVWTSGTVSDCIIEGNLGTGVVVNVWDFSRPTPVFNILRTIIRNNTGSGITWRTQTGSSRLELVVDDSEISHNGGRGIDFVFSSTTRLRNTVIEGNSGIGIYLENARVTLEDSIIRRNLGTGIYAWEGSARLVRTAVDGNQGGGLFLGAIYSDFHLVDSAIIRNVGGGIATSGSLVVENSTISGNTNSATGAGGIEMHPYSHPVIVRNSTIVANQGSTAGGIGTSSLVDWFHPTASMSGSILSGNTSSSGPSDCGQFAQPGGELVRFTGDNLLGNTEGCAFTATPTDQIGTAADPIDPLLGPLADNGGPTPTHALLPGSPALDAITGACPTSDQRGFGRPHDGNGDSVALCDIGAYELAPAGADLDGDEVGDLEDNCVATANAAQTDSDDDGPGDVCDNCASIANHFQDDRDSDSVGDACDNCVHIANPRMPAAWLSSNPWAVLTGGQRDDDFDGYGNVCDAKFPGSAGTVVSSADLTQFRASIGRARTATTCGSSHVLACAIFDLDESSLVIGTPDLTRFRALNGQSPGPKCATCPLLCEAGALRSCAP